MFTVHIGNPTRDNERKADMSFTTQKAPVLAHLEPHTVIVIKEDCAGKSNRVFLSLTNDQMIGLRDLLSISLNPEEENLSLGEAGTSKGSIIEPHADKHLHE